MEEQKAILMIVNSDTAANGFWALAQRFSSKGNIQSVMVCHPRVHIDNVKKKCKELGDSITILDFDARQRLQNDKLAASEYQYKKDVIFVSLVKAVFNLIKIVAQNLWGLRRAKDFMDKVNPHIILLYADNKSELEKFFIYIAKKRKIKTIIAPICYSLINDVFVNVTNGFRINKEDKLPITAKIVKHLNPKAERLYKDEIVFFRQPFSEIINQVMGLNAPNPWIQGSWADIVCTSYLQQYSEILEELGAENASGRLFLTESVEDEMIINGYQNREQLQKKLSEKYHLHSEKAVIIAFSERISQMPKENDLFDKGIIVQSVLAYYDEVLVSLHPKSDVQENMFLEEYEGCHIVDEPLREIVGVADLIVCGDISSVGQWADMLKINRVTYPSFSMQSKWSDSEIQDFRRKLEDSTKMASENDVLELMRGIDFVDFVLDLM